MQVNERALMSEQEPRYSSLRDYLALLRRQVPVIVAVTLAFGGAAFALSAGQMPALLVRSGDSVQRHRARRGHYDRDRAPSRHQSGREGLSRIRGTRSIYTARKVARRSTRHLSRRVRETRSPRMWAHRRSSCRSPRVWDEAEFAADLVNAYADVSIGDENSQLKETLVISVEQAPADREGQAHGRQREPQPLRLQCPQSAW